MRLAGFVRHTPLVFSPSLSEKTGCQVYLKVECWQVCGCFKVRGAINMISSLEEADRRRGLVTASSGNHGIAVAYAAGLFGRVPATVFLPENADRTKVGKLERLGAEADLPDVDVVLVPIGGGWFPGSPRHCVPYPRR